MAVSERVRDLREQKGISQRQLAEDVGVSQSLINQIERGTKNPSLQVACSIAEALDCKVEDLVKKQTVGN